MRVLQIFPIQVRKLCECLAVETFLRLIKHGIECLKESAPICREVFGWVTVVTQMSRPHFLMEI
jgi:hypothetical protein